VLLGFFIGVVSCFWLDVGLILMVCYLRCVLCCIIGYGMLFSYLCVMISVLDSYGCNGFERVVVLLDFIYVIL